MRRLGGIAVTTTLAGAILFGVQGLAQNRMVEWPYYGGQQAHTKYSLAADITPENVGRLALAWQWAPGHKTIEGGTRPDLFENTPLMIDNVLYVSTSNDRVVALDADTGAELWAFDSGSAADPGGAGVHRGVAYWRDGDDARIFLNSRHRLFALNAKTGALITSFGRSGFAMMNEGLRRPIDKRFMDQTSPPVVYKNLVIVGSSINDRLVVKADPVGSVQAFDVRTGRRIWVFYTVPYPGEFGNDTWEKESWAITGHSNVWGIMSVDEARGLLYAPTSTPSGDFWGGRRPGANLFAESLLCLDANTGQRKWHFQGVHHGIWDYDFMSAPTLLSINVDGKSIDAVAQSGKQGFTYVFDRATGAPVWPIVEQSVLTDSDVPGEKVYPTQPFPTKPPAFAPQGVSEADANDLTPEIHQLALEEMRQLRLGPLFTPPSLRGTLQRPSAGGGANWGSAGADPETGILYLKVSEHTSVNQVCPQDGKTPMTFLGIRSDIAFNTNDCSVNTAGTGPYGAPRQPRKLGALPIVATGSGEDAMLAAFALPGTDSTTTPREVRPSAPTVSPTAPAPAASQPTSGKEAYDRVCRVCHGEDARGDTGPRLVPFSRGYEEMLAIVREGTGRMPPISARELSDESVALVAAYLTSLAP